MGNDELQFGHGRDAKPLHTAQNRRAEAIRQVLRKVNCRELSDDHGGFAVIGGRGGFPFLVACADDEHICATELPRYDATLRAAGYRVEPDPDDSRILRVWPPS